MTFKLLGKVRSSAKVFSVIRVSQPPTSNKRKQEEPTAVACGAANLMLPNRSAASSPSDRVPKAPKRRLETPSTCAGSSDKPSIFVKENSDDEWSTGSPVSPATEQFIRQRLKDKMRSSALRDLLQKSLSLMDQGDKSSSEAATFAEGLGSFNKYDGCASTMASSSYYSQSEVSNASEDAKKAPMDIYHPDFWSACSQESSSEDTVSVSSMHRSTPSGFAPLSLSDVRNGAFVVSGMKPKTVERDDHSVVSDVTVQSEAFGLCKVDCETSSTASTRIHHSIYAKSSSDSDAPSILSQTSSSRRQFKRKGRRTSSVRFGNVNVRQYDRIMSDNPACRTGPGIGIDWTYEAAEVEVSVDEWEDRRTRSRSGSIVALSRSKREQIIRELGYSDRDIAAMCRELNKLRSYRRQTVNNLGLEQLEIAIENAKRTCRNMLLSSLRKS